MGCVTLRGRVRHPPATQGQLSLDIPSREGATSKTKMVTACQRRNGELRVTIGPVTSTVAITMLLADVRSWRESLIRFRYNTCGSKSEA